MSVQDEVADTGLMLMGHRFYDPGLLGRFLNRDPSGFNGSFMNLYVYPTNPASLVDPSGLEPYDENKVYNDLIKNGYSPDDADTLEHAARIVHKYDPNPTNSKYGITDMMEIVTPIPEGEHSHVSGRTRRAFPRGAVVQIRADVPQGSSWSEADVYRIAVVANELYYYRHIMDCGDPGESYSQIWCTAGEIK